MGTSEIICLDKLCKVNKVRVKQDSYNYLVQSNPIKFMSSDLMCNCGLLSIVQLLLDSDTVVTPTISCDSLIKSSADVQLLITLCMSMMCVQFS